MLIVIIYVGIIKALDIYTNHGESITVPDLREMTIDQIDEILQNKNLKYKIADSIIYKTDKPPLTIFDQKPKPYSKVKRNRTIYLSVNAKNPPKVKLPDLKDASLTQAEMILSMMELKIGELIYRPDMAKNVVLEQQMEGKEVEEGTEIYKGTEIDLVLGDGLGNTLVDIPDLYGLTLGEAKSVLLTYFLNLGVFLCDKTVKDTLSAKVYKQIPPANQDISIRLGEAVDVMLTGNLSGIKKADTLLNINNE